MRNVHPHVSAAHASGKLSIRGAIEFRLGGGVHRFVKDVEPRLWGGNTYYPGGFLKVTDHSSEIGFSASSFTISIASNDIKDYSPQKFKEILQQDYRGREVLISDLYLSLESKEIVTSVLRLSGKIEKAVLVKNDGVSVIEVHCADDAIDFSNVNGRLATSVDQKRRNPNDRFLEGVSNIDDIEIYFGKSPPSNGGY